MENYICTGNMTLDIDGKPYIMTNNGKSHKLSSGNPKVQSLVRLGLLKPIVKTEDDKTDKTKKGAK